MQEYILVAMYKQIALGYCLGFVPLFVFSGYQIYVQLFWIVRLPRSPANIIWKIPDITGFGIKIASLNMQINPCRNLQTDFSGVFIA
jgi:hypothetical protein